MGAHTDNGHWLKGNLGLPTKGIRDAFRAEYVAWLGMRDRCCRKDRHNYHRYGGRGIKIAPRWQSFIYFIWDMGPKPSPSMTLDRINNDGDYEPSNCRWATKQEQSANRNGGWSRRPKSGVAVQPKAARAAA